MIQPIMTHLQIHTIESNVGFTILQEKQMTIPTTYNYSLHVIDLNEIDDLIMSLTTSVTLFPDNMTNDLMFEISKLEDKFATLQSGHHTIHKRGILNFLGTIDKWIKGTMDDNDRQTINNHLVNIDINNHNVIKTINQQVLINNNFSISIQRLANVIKTDREVIFDMLNQTNSHSRQLALFEIKLHIQTVDRLLSDLQDNILLSHLDIIHPSILTHNEIQLYHITADKIRYLRLGFARTTTGKLIFLVKIPFETTLVNKKLIHPLRTPDTCQMINFPITHVIEHNNHYYEFDNNKAFSQLHSPNHCIFQKNCEFIENCDSDIRILDDSSVLVQLRKESVLTSTCDERIFTLHGNYFIEFYNCTIILNNITYFNQVNKVTHKYVIPTLRNTPGNDTVSKLTQIDLPEIRNLHPIHEIFYTEPFIYGSTLVAILFVLFVITIIICYFKYVPSPRHSINSIQENFSDNERGVIFLQPLPLPTQQNIHPHDKILF